MQIDDGGVKRHDASYRRGLVLGLTMAEIMVLVLFTLLLALAAAIANREASIVDLTEKVRILEVVEKQIAELMQKNPQGINVIDIIQRIARHQEEIARLQQEREDLIRKNPNGINVNDIVQRIHRLEEIAKKWEIVSNQATLAGITEPTPENIVGGLRASVQLEKENRNLGGQIKQLSQQIKESGRGNEFPSCWATEDGKTESIFEILIKPNGIIVFDRNLPHHDAEKALLPIANIRYRIDLELREFQRDIRPLYQWSVENRCRFYVIIFSSESEVRTDLVNAVNAFFYPDSRIKVRRTEETP